MASAPPDFSGFSPYSSEGSDGERNSGKRLGDSKSWTNVAQRGAGSALFVPRPGSGLGSRGGSLPDAGSKRASFIDGGTVGKRSSCGAKEERASLRNAKTSFAVADDDEVGKVDSVKSSVSFASRRKSMVSPGVLAALSLPGGGAGSISRRGSALPDDQGTNTRQDMIRKQDTGEALDQIKRRMSVMDLGKKTAGRGSTGAGGLDAAKAVGLTSGNMFVLKTMMAASMGSEGSEYETSSDETSSSEEDEEEEDNLAMAIHRGSRNSVIRMSKDASSAVNSDNLKMSSQLAVLMTAQEAKAEAGTERKDKKKGDSANLEISPDAANQAVRNAKAIQNLILDSGDEQGKCYEKWLRKKANPPTRQESQRNSCGPSLAERGEMEARKTVQKLRRKRRLGIAYRLRGKYGENPTGLETLGDLDDYNPEKRRSSATGRRSSSNQRRSSASGRRRSSLNSHSSSSGDRRTSMSDRRGSASSQAAEKSQNGRRRSSAGGRRSSGASNASPFDKRKSQITRQKTLEVVSTPLASDLFSLVEVATPMATPMGSRRVSLEDQVKTRRSSMERVAAIAEYRSGSKDSALTKSSTYVSEEPIRLVCEGSAMEGESRNEATSQQTISLNGLVTSSVTPVGFGNLFAPSGVAFVRSETIHVLPDMDADLPQRVGNGSINFSRCSMSAEAEVSCGSTFSLDSLPPLPHTAPGLGEGALDGASPPRRAKASIVKIVQRASFQRDSVKFSNKAEETDAGSRNSSRPASASRPVSRTKTPDPYQDSERGISRGLESPASTWSNSNYSRKRLPEIPRLRSKFRDRRFILSDNWRSSADTIKRYHLEVAAHLGLEETDWSYIGNSIYKVGIAGLTRAADRKEENYQNEMAATIQRNWRAARLWRTCVRLRRERHRATAKIVRWWHRKSAYQLPIHRRVVFRPIEKRAAIKVQALARGMMTRHSLSFQRGLHSVTWRMQCLRKDIGGSEFDNICKVQALVRGYLARRRVQKLREEKKYVEEAARKKESALIKRKTGRTSFSVKPADDLSGKRSSLLIGRRQSLVAGVRRSTESGGVMAAMAAAAAAAHAADKAAGTTRHKTSALAGHTEESGSESSSRDDTSDDDKEAKAEQHGDRYVIFPGCRAMTPVGVRLKRPLDISMKRMGGLAPERRPVSRIVPKRLSRPVQTPVSGVVPKRMSRPVSRK